MALTLAVALVAPAVAAETGVSLVYAKDLARRTLTLSGERVVRVSLTTQIEDVHGNRMRLEDVPVAERRGGAVVADPAAVVEYEAADDGEEAILYRLRVGVPLPE